MTIFLNGRPMPLEVLRDSLFKDIVHRKEWDDADVDKIELTLGARFRDAGFKNGLVDDFQVFDRRLTAIEAKCLAGASMPPSAAGSGEPDQELLEYYLNRHDAEYQSALADLRRWREDENNLVNDVREIMVMQELPTRVRPLCSSAGPTTLRWSGWNRARRTRSCRFPPDCPATGWVWPNG